LKAAHQSRVAMGIGELEFDAARVISRHSVNLKF
jgi:hypothetical protein